MFDDGFDPGSSRKEEDGDDTGGASALTVITALDTEEREWSEGENRPGSASHRRPSGSSPSPGQRGSERERLGSEMEVRGSGGGGGKSPSKGKSGSPSKGKGKGKPSKGGPVTRHERSPRERARSFSNLPYPEPAVPGQWVPSKLLGEEGPSSSDITPIISSNPIPCHHPPHTTYMISLRCQMTMMPWSTPTTR